MLAILSPAKDMKVLPEQVNATNFHTIPEFLNKAAELIIDLKRLKPVQLADLMKISNKLAVLNYDRYRNWNKEHTVENSSQAILSFTGEAYRGLDASTFNEKQLMYSQQVLRILSGLYGVIKPLDLIQAYRLEMGTRHAFRKKKNLYEFWSQNVSKTLDHAVEESPGDKVLVNVASTEYASVINFKKLKSRVVTPVFYQEDNGELNMVAVFAKRARGMMVRFIIENELTAIEDIKAFNADGYYFDAKRSVDDRWVFVR